MTPPTTSQANSAEGAVELASRLQRQLSARFRGVSIHVKSEGVVLQGRVRNYYAKQLAQEIVMGSTDVPIVGNEIEVD